MAPPAVTTAAAPAAPSSSGKKRKAHDDAQQGNSSHKQLCAAEPFPPQQQPIQNEYELQRQQRIERNRQIMQELGVEQAAAAVKQSMNSSKRQRTANKKKAPAAEAAPAPSRRSNRIAAQPAEVSAAEADAAVDADDHAALLTQEQYFTLIGKDMPAEQESDGKFKGWVHPDVCTMYGIAGSAAEAWEANGGGKWSRKPDMSAVSAHLRAKGWSEAKAFAATMLRKNPNTYFYRHVAPHETQAQGEWTQEEHELFMSTAKQHGVGDKWGLFSSYIPQRVGYQCSAYYRDVVVAQGLIRDSRFRMTRGGRAVFVAGKEH